MNFQFPQIITNRRKELQLTQEQVARFIGVSRAAVSKWEQGQSYPDIILLPKLAMYFDRTIDELLGYEPQLTNAVIEKLYEQMAKDFTERPFEEVMHEIDARVAEYYSCYPFLVKVAQLYINHVALAPDVTTLCEKTIELCQRVKENAEDIQLINEATAIEALCYVSMQKPQEVLELLGENIALQFGYEQLIVTAHHMLGNKDKAKMLMQVTYYQQLIGLLNSAIETLMLEADHPAYTEKTVNRIEELLALYDVHQLHENSVLVFYLKATSVYMMQGNMDAAKQMLEKYMRYVIQLKFPLHLKGDDYFYLLEKWMDEQTNTLKNVPRDQRAIKKDLVNTLLNPMFSPLLQDSELQALYETMKYHLEKE